MQQIQRLCNRYSARAANTALVQPMQFLGSKTVPAQQLQCPCSYNSACAADTVPAQQMKCLCDKDGACAADPAPVQQTQCLCSRCSACAANTVPVHCAANEVPVQQRQRLCSKCSACAANTVHAQQIKRPCIKFIPAAFVHILLHFACYCHRPRLNLFRRFSLTLCNLCFACYATALGSTHFGGFRSHLGIRTWCFCALLVIQGLVGT